MWPQKIWVKKDFWPKKFFCYQIFLATKNFWSKKKFRQKKFVLKKNSFATKSSWWKKFVGQKQFLVKEIYLKTLLVKKIKVQRFFDQEIL